MPVNEPATKVTIFLSEDDRIGHRGVHEALLERAREEGLAGATVWRGIQGFGKSGHIRSDRFPDANTGLPLALEVIDHPERIDTFLPVVSELAPGSFVTRERVEITRFRSPTSPSLDDPDPRHAPS